MHDRPTKTHTHTHTTKEREKNTKTHKVVNTYRSQNRTMWLWVIEHHTVGTVKKSTCSTDCLNRGNEEKSTLVVGNVQLFVRTFALF